MPGDHSTATCQQLWDKVPPSYKNCPSFADAWPTYAQVVPPEQLHQQQKKGPTNRLERFNLTLRQRVGRLTRKTLSFSKSYPMHLIHIRRFLLQYNHYCIHRFNQSLPT